MTPAFASQPDTALALFFGGAEHPSDVIAGRFLASALSGNLSPLAGMPETVRQAAVSEVASAVADLLEISLIDVLIDGWREHHELTAAARRTLAAPRGTELIRLAPHRITAALQPYVSVIVDGDRVATVQLQLTFIFDISDLTAGVSSGRLISLHAGHCDLTGTLAIQGADNALTKQAHLQLPGTSSFPDGILLLPAQDYESPARTPATEVHQSVRTDASPARTILMPKIQTQQDAMPAQPPPAPLPWMTGDRSMPGPTEDPHDQEPT